MPWNEITATVESVDIISYTFTNMYIKVKIYFRGFFMALCERLTMKIGLGLCLGGVFAYLKMDNSISAI